MTHRIPRRLRLARFPVELHALSQDPAGSGLSPASVQAVCPDVVQDGCELLAVAALLGGDQDPQRLTVFLTAQRQLSGPTTRTPQCVISRSDTATPDATGTP
jgi:hypothetical protein